MEAENKEGQFQTIQCDKYISESFVYIKIDSLVPGKSYQLIISLSSKDGSIHKIMKSDAFEATGNYKFKTIYLFHFLF